MNNFSYLLACSFSIVSNSHFLFLIKVGDILNEKQLCLSNTKTFSFKNAEKKYIILEKKQQDQFHKALMN